MPRSWPVLAALFACAAAPAAEQTLPVEYFTHPPDLGRVQIAPDGQVLAAEYEVKGESHLAFLNLHELGDVREIVAPLGMDFRDFQWVSATRVVYRLELRQFGVLPPVSTGELLAIDRDGTSPQYVYGCRTPNKGAPDAQPTTPNSNATNPAAGDDESAAPATCGTAELLSPLAKDDRRILVAEYFWLNEGNQFRADPDAAPAVALLDTYDGKEQILTRLSLRGGRVLVDGEDRARFGVGRSERDRLTVAWQAQPDGAWTSFPLSGFAEQSITPVKLSEDARAAMFIGRRERDPRKALWRLDLASRAASKLYEHAQVDVESAIEDPSGRKVIGVRVDADQPENHWLDESDPAVKLYQSLERAFPGQAVEITSATADRRQAIAFVQSDVNPGDYYLVDTQTRNAQYLRSARSWVDPERMRHKESIELKSRDGKTLHGYLTRPKDAKPPFEMVVLVHGGPFNVRDGWRFDWEAQLLSEFGYAVLQVNYRGSGGYGDDFLRAGYREWGGKMQDDVTDATKWAIAQGIAAADKVCIFGTGYGGYAAVMGTVREPKLYRCAAAYDGLFDLELLVGRDDPQITPPARAYLDRVLGSDAKALRKRSPIANVDQIETPILIIAGGDPAQIEYQHANRLETALKDAGKPVDTAAVRYREDAYKRLLDFLSRHLRTEASAKQGGAALAAD